MAEEDFEFDVSGRKKGLKERVVSIYTELVGLFKKNLALFPRRASCDLFCFSVGFDPWS